MARTLISGGTVVTATDTTAADVLIDGERVVAVGSDLGAQAEQVIDATGRLVTPGGIDVHTHMEMPFGGTFSSDDFATGTAAAAWGGTTTIVDFAVPEHGESLQGAAQRWHQKAGPKAHVDYGFHMIVREVNEQTLADMDALIDQGITSFKLFMAYPGVFMVDDASLFRAMTRSGDNGALIMLHAENGGPIDVLIQRYLAAGRTDPVNHGLTRPASMEGEATHRAIALAELAGVAVYIVHLSSTDALNAVREARDSGVAALAETCPQYLFLSADDLARPGFEGAKYVCSPPLRPKPHQAELWNGLRSDDLQLVATDHCPFHFKQQKEMGLGNFAKIPNGLPGVEDRYTLLYDGGVRSGQVSLNRFVELVATAPAKLFGLYPRKGTIAPGSDADIVVFDPDTERVLSASTHHMNVDYSCYEGQRVHGVPEVVLQRGQVLVDHGKLLAQAGQGRFVARSRSGL
jgi:dihydropyrimidinase